MKTLEMLESMLPPELVGVPGATKFNERRKQALQEVEPVHRHGAVALDRARNDDHAKRGEIEAGIVAATSRFSRVVSELKQERESLMRTPTEPFPDLANMKNWNTPAKLAALKAYNAAQRAFNESPSISNKFALNKAHAACVAITKGKK